MAQELIYTSVPQGLRLGTSGFCTVACTRGMAPNYVEVLESLSGYTPVFPLNHPEAARNPPAVSHYRFTIGGRQASVLSRVTAAGVDYTKRANKFAYHVVLDPKERPDGGPAWLMQQPAVMLERWEGEPRFLDRPKRIPAGNLSPAHCKTWKQYAGDAGWAGVLAQSFLDDSGQAAFLVFEPGTPMLDLVGEALGLLSEAQRWRVTFNTYFSSLPMGTSCLWRCCLPDSDALKHARRTRGALVLDLTSKGKQPPVAEALMRKDSALIGCARMGTGPPPLLPARKPAGEEAPAPPEEEWGSDQGAYRVAPLPPSAAQSRYDAEPDTPPSRPHGTLGWKIATVFLTILFLVAAALRVYLWKRPAETGRAGGAELAQAREKIGQLEQMLAESDLERHHLKAANAAQKTEIDDLTRQLEEHRQQAARPEAATRPPPPPPAAPKAQTIACIGTMAEVMRSFAEGKEWEIRVAGLPDGCRVQKIGWWETEQPDAHLRQKGRTTLDVTGLNAFGVRERFLTVAASRGRLVFTKGEKVKGELLEIVTEKAGFDRVAWIELRDGEKKILVFTRERPQADIRLIRKGRGVFEKTNISVDPILRESGERGWEHGQGNKVRYEHGFAHNGLMYLRVQFNEVAIRKSVAGRPASGRKPAPRRMGIGKLIREERARVEDEAFAQPFEFRADQAEGRSASVIARLKLTPGG